MNDTVTLILSLGAALTVGICRKYYMNKNSGIRPVLIFNAVGSITAAVVLMCWGGFGSMSVFTLFMGMAFGAVTALQGITNLSALQCGPLSYTSVIVSFSTLITAMSGTLFFGEDPLSPMQIVGMVLMLISFVLATGGDRSERRANLKWLLLCAIAFFATGGIGIMQKVHQSSQFRGELNAFLVIAFVSTSIICAIFAAVLKMKSGCGEERNGGMNGSFWIMMAVILVNGICVAANNKFNLYLSGVMDSAVFFPIVNGGGLVLATLAALLIFREKLRRKQWIGLIIGIASVVFICDPFG